MTGAFAWSPTGRRLAFVDHGRLDTIRVDGTGLRHLSRALGGSVAWVPSAGRIAFLADVHGRQQVLVIDSNGKGRRAVTTDGCLHDSLSWSQDGRLFFTAQGSDC